MIIVSQDKTKIINFDNVEEIKIVKIIDKNHEIKKLQIVALGQYEYELADYKTEERAKEVLAEIVQKYSSYLQLKGGPAILQGQSDIAPAIFNIPKVYEMPEK